MQIEAGGTYRTRNGHKVGPLTWHPRFEAWVWKDRPYIGDNRTAWYENGQYWQDGKEWPMDIVAVWREPAAETPATTSPVRRRTVTEVTIEAGHYGIVRVGEPHGLEPNRANILIPNHWYGPSELRAAAATLTELASALEEQAK